MASETHLKLIGEGVDAWNQWRKDNPGTLPDLFGAEFVGVDLSLMDLSRADLRAAHLGKATLVLTNLQGANLFRADLNRATVHSGLSNANLSEANLREADVSRSNLSGADLSKASLVDASLGSANLEAANLYRADLHRADLTAANLRGANLRRATLARAKLEAADLRGADLFGASLYGALLIETLIEGATLTNAEVYGISAWNLEGQPADQTNLVITQSNEPLVTVDDLKVAQFIHLLLSNPTIRDVIDTITSKVVLILGRFTEERKEVLDELRNQLREHNLSPVVFDFAIPTTRDVTDTVRLLAGMARFVIADLTDPATIPYELGSFVPGVLVPVRPVILAGEETPHGFEDLRTRHHWLLDPYVYSSIEALVENIETEIIQPAEDKRRDLDAGRRK